MVVHSKEKVFITGINGFTGKHLERYLKDFGYDVYGSVLEKPLYKNHFSSDILNEDSIYEILNKVKPNYIIHLAAISFVATKNQQSIYNVNIFGTLNLLNAIEKLNYKPQKILIASSAAVYGNVEGELNEKMCPQPVNHYGNSKLAMENMVKHYFENQNIIIARPFNYTGVGQEKEFLIPKIVSHFQQNKPEIELGNIDVYREFNDVGFVVKCYTELLLSNIKSEIVNVCSGNAINIKSIINIMDNIAGYNINVKINPEFVRKNEIKILKGSNKKLSSIIGDFNNNFKIEDTLKEIYIN